MINLIKNKKDYLHYIECDRIALSRNKRTIISCFKSWIIKDEVWKFQRALRKYEYAKNCRKGVLSNFYWVITKLRYNRLSIKLGFAIPPNVFGAGLAIAHSGTIVVNGGAKIGRNCRLNVGVNIGTKAGGDISAPTIGDNVYIGPGAKLFGDIIIADGIAIGANAVVNKSFEDTNITIAGVPARKISDKGSEGLLIIT